MAISSLSVGGPPVAQNPPAAQAQGTGGSAAVVPASQANQAQALPSKEQVQKAIKTVQDMVQAQASNLQFSQDKETGRTIVTVVDTSTNEVIRQIPSKEMVAIAHAIDQMDSKSHGLMLNQIA